MTKKVETGSFLAIEWSVENGKLNIRAKRNKKLAVKKLSGSVTIDGKTLFLKDGKENARKESIDADGNGMCVIEFSFDVHDIIWAWEITGKEDRLELISTLKNNSKNDIIVSDWNVLHAQEKTGGIVNLGENGEQVRFFGWRGWTTQVERFSKSESTHDSATICHLFDPASGITFFSGFVTVDRMQSSHSMAYSESVGITQYCATCSFGEHRIDAGRELKSETLRVSYHGDPYAALESWATQVHDTYRPSFEGTLDVSWGGGAWQDAFTSKEEAWSDILIESAEAIRRRLKGFDIKYIKGGTHEILKGGLPGNWLTFEKTGNNDDYRELFKKVQKMGFVLKLWFSPFWFFGETEEGALEGNRENLLKDKEGKIISDKGTWEFDRHYNADDEAYLTKYYLDGTHPKTKEYITNIFKAYRDMGARAYMLDFLYIKPEAKLYDDSLLPMEAVRKILEVIRKAAKSDTHLQTAVASTPGFIGCINAARVVRDYGEGRPMYPFHNWKNATYCMHDHHFADEYSFVQNAAASWFTHMKVYANDLNQLTVDKPVPLEHARISTTMFGLSGGSPMNLGDDIRTIDPERLRMLKMCLPRTKGVPVPVDLFDHVAPENYCRMLKKTVETKWDSYMLVAVFNMDDKEYSTDIDFVKLGYDKDEIFRIFEFWNEEYVGTYKESYSCVVPAHACRLYRISRARQYPWLLSTDMHVEQGAVDVESLSWDETTMTLKGTAVRPAGEKGSLLFLIPRQLKLINHEKANTMKEVIDMQTVIRLPIEFESEKEAFELRFELMNTNLVAREGWLPFVTEAEWLEYVEANRKPNDTRIIE